MNNQLIEVTNSDQVVFRLLYSKLHNARSYILENLISLVAQKYNKSKLHVFLLYINTVISYSFKVESAIAKKMYDLTVFAAILKITQDALTCFY